MCGGFRVSRITSCDAVTATQSYSLRYSCFHCSMALPTNGRVILDTTVGEIDIELWAKVNHLNAPETFVKP